MCEHRDVATKKELTAHTVYVKFRWPDFTTFTRQRSVTVGIDNEEEILRLAHVIWQDNWQAGQALRLLGVGVSNLETAVVRQLLMNSGWTNTGRAVSNLETAVVRQLSFDII